ncbi:methylmalonyl-CoA mutase subunit beta [Seonamhaeicola sp. MEBiC1930]|uniref:methylmalonyl-CoA mutase subunit beta n=1 Tax=Seonamhaeicola sp. MEBiC01930 TaxID=2976768 RepID=UPI003253C43F
MSKQLFNAFDSVSSKQWKQKIQFDLNGADYNNALVWNSNENISVKPFYHSDDFKELPDTSNTKATQWKTCESIFVANAEKSNKRVIDALNGGAESIRLIIPSEDISVENVLKTIDLSSTLIHLKLEFLSPSYVKNLTNILTNSRVYFDNDIIGNIARTGNWFKDLKDDISKFDSIFKQTNSFSVDVSLYQNAGANMVQQLAYALSHANEYLNLSQNTNQSTNAIFNVSIGTNYFFEIAKLKALRLLWNTLVSEYKINTDCHIFATPTKRNKTIYDYNTNMLRTTTECMSAILGGANTVNNLAYDAIYHKNNEFGDRIARNQLLILKNESYFNKVNNPSDGAYYIESITNQLAEKALNLFKNIEANGGFLKQLKDGIIQRKIKESAIKEQEQFNSGEETLLGTNKHPNPSDKMKVNIDLYPFIKTKQRKTLIEPIIEKRLAENLEKKRLKNEH